MDSVNFLKRRLSSDFDLFSRTTDYALVLSNTVLDAKTVINEELLCSVLFMDKTAKKQISSMESLVYDLSNLSGVSPKTVLSENDLVLGKRLVEYNEKMKRIKEVVDNEFNSLSGVNRDISLSVLGLPLLTSSLDYLSSVVITPIFNTEDLVSAKVESLLSQIDFNQLRDKSPFFTFVNNTAFYLNILESFVNNSAFYLVDNYSKGKINTDSVYTLNFTTDSLTALGLLVSICRSYVIDLGVRYTDSLTDDKKFSHVFMYHFFKKEVDRYTHCLELLKYSVNKLLTESDASLGLKKKSILELIEDAHRKVVECLFKVPTLSASEMQDSPKYSDKANLFNASYKGLLLLSTFVNPDTTFLSHLGANEFLQSMQNGVIKPLGEQIVQLGVLLNDVNSDEVKELSTHQKSHYFVHFMVLGASIVTHNEYLKESVLKALEEL